MYTNMHICVHMFILNVDFDDLLVYEKYRKLRALFRIE